MRDARMIFVESSGGEARSTSVAIGPLMTWLASVPTTEDGRVAWRTADVGAIVLAEVMVVSLHEARVATEAARVEAARTQSDDVLQLCDAVAALIAPAKPAEYYSAWVVIETADID